MQAAREVVRDDDIIDDKLVEIEEQCIHIIATQTPVARDLRYLLAVLHIGTELERMADYAEGIGKISLMMGDEPPLKPLIELLTYMIEDPRNIKRATYLVWVAHDLERVADRATNIAEQVLFLVTGSKKKIPAVQR